MATAKDVEPQTQKPTVMTLLQHLQTRVTELEDRERATGRSIANDLRALADTLGIPLPSEEGQATPAGIRYP